MPVAGKLQIKPGSVVAIRGLPGGVKLDLPDGCSESTDVSDASRADVVIVFATDRASLNNVAQPVVDAALKDRLAWVAYPKGGQLGTDLNRDVLAGLMSERGVQAVRQVAIDDVWSALRFRPAS